MSSYNNTEEMMTIAVMMMVMLGLHSVAKQLIAKYLNPVQKVSSAQEQVKRIEEPTEREEVSSSSDSFAVAATVAALAVLTDMSAVCSSLNRPVGESQFVHSTKAPSTPIVETPMVDTDFTEMPLLLEADDELFNADDDSSEIDTQPDTTDIPTWVRELAEVGSSFFSTETQISETPETVSPSNTPRSLKMWSLFDSISETPTSCGSSYYSDLSTKADTDSCSQSCDPDSDDEDIEVVSYARSWGPIKSRVYAEQPSQPILVA